MSVIDELAIKLKLAHAAAPKDRKVASIHLFGIANHEALAGVNKFDVAERAGLSRSYGTELSKAAVLGTYVTITRPLA